MGMETELILVGALFIIFIGSFCGLLQKLRKTYENDRILNERAINAATSSSALSEIYINTTFANGDDYSRRSSEEGAVFPSAPPPYSEVPYDAPPKYEDIIKFDSSGAVRFHPGSL